MKTKITAKPLPESENGYKIDLSEATQEERKEAQELAFELGWEWRSGNVYKEERPFLFLQSNKKLEYLTLHYRSRFEESENTPITLTDLRAAVKFKNRPVDVAIPYSNEEERKAAIKQAESWGYPEWEHNQGYRNDDDNCIFLHKDDYWNDCEFESYDRLLLDRSFMKPDVKENFTTENFHTYPKSDYTPEPQDNGDILLRKVDKELEAAKALLRADTILRSSVNFEQIARLMVEFKNAE